MPTAAADPVVATATVLNVVDGDTIEIRDDTRGRFGVRLLGIDTPGNEETRLLHWLLGIRGNGIRQVNHGRATSCAGARTDAGQHRPLRPDSAYLVRADGWDYSVEAARAGAAHSYVYGGVPVSRYDAIEAAQKEARDALRGLWGPPCNGEQRRPSPTHKSHHHRRHRPLHRHRVRHSSPCLRHLRRAF